MNEIENKADFLIKEARYEYAINGKGISLYLKDAYIKILTNLPNMDEYVHCEILDGVAVITNNGDTSWLKNGNIVSIPIDSFLNPMEKTTRH